MSKQNIQINDIDNYIPCNETISKITITGNITKIMTLEHKNNQCPIQKINKEEYVLLETGEIKEYEHIENRGQDMTTIRKSVVSLREIINNNFFGGNNELWVTLTFGKNKIYDPKQLYFIFEKFIKRLRYKYKKEETTFDYIYVPEPHEKGDWHIHLLLKSNKPIFIANSELRTVWGQGFVKVNRLKDVDNIGAYVSAYLTNIKNGEETKKGARLYLYPPNHQLYRCSSGIKKPVSVYIPYEKAKKEVSSDKLTYSKTLKIMDATTNFNNIVHYEYYNSKR